MSFARRAPIDVATHALRTALPEPASDALRGCIRGFGTATGFMRPLPDFLILGAQKSGTTALYTYLLRHPGVGGPVRKEVEFFDRYFARGTAWYRGHFPTSLLRGYVKVRHGLELVAGEASPSYLFHPWAPQRVAAVVPRARLIVILRNPVDRALSHHAHEVVAGREALSFEEASEREPERIGADVARMERDASYFSEEWRNHSYLARGRYAEQLERWFRVFPRDRFLILASESELSRAPADTYATTLRFIGAEAKTLPSYPRVLERDYPEMRPDTRRRLEEYFRGPNQRLYELVGRDFGWDR